MNKLGKVVASSVLVGLALGLTACGEDKPPKDFKKACDAAGGKTERDHESLGMAPMAFDISRPKPAPKAKTPKVKKAPKNNGWKLAGGSHKSTAKPKKSKKSKTDDNEWVCMKNGVELFDEE